HKAAIIGGDDRSRTLAIPGVSQHDASPGQPMSGALVDDYSSDPKSTTRDRILTAAGNLSRQNRRRAQHHQTDCEKRECTQPQGTGHLTHSSRLTAVVYVPFGLRPNAQSDLSRHTPASLRNSRIRGPAAGG